MAEGSQSADGHAPYFRQPSTTHGQHQPGSTVPSQDRRRTEDRAEGLDARCLPQEPHPPDQPARAQRGGGHAARRQLDHTGTQLEAQGHPLGQGAGRSRSWPVPVQRRGDDGRFTRTDHRRPAERQGQVQQHLQLPHAHLGGYRCRGLAGGRRRHHESGDALPHQLRPIRAGHGADLQGGELPSAAGPSTAASSTTRRSRGPT